MPNRLFLRRRCTSALLALAAFTLRAQAHEVWIEDTPDGQLIVRFAEYGEKFEKSPGALDALTLPFAWKPDTEVKQETRNSGAESPGAREDRDIRAGQVAAVEVHKEADGFALV